MILKTPGTIHPPRYNVRMRLARDNGNTPAGTWVCLSVRNRIAWSKRTAQKHLADVSKDRRFTDSYNAFIIEQD